MKTNFQIKNNKRKVAIWSLLVAVPFMQTHGVFAGPAEDAQSGVNYIEDSSSTTVTVAGLLVIVVNTLLFLVGSVSVIMIIIGGIRFVISRGDQQAAADARNTVLYAVIGILTAVTAYGIVNFVLGKLYAT